MSYENQDFRELRNYLFLNNFNDINLLKETIEKYKLVKIEESKLIKEDVNCPLESKYKQIDLDISNLRPDEISKKLETDFNDISVLNAISCIIKSIKSASGKTFNDNEVMRRYIDNVKRIGENSAYGIVMTEDLTKDHYKYSHDFSVIKVPKDKAAESDLIHELYVGTRFINPMRKYCLNFIYTYGSFYCNQPYIGQNRKALSFCSGHDDKNNILHVMTENIKHSISFSNFLKKCTAKEFVMYYLQVILATELANNYVGYHHTDLHTDNVLLRPVPYKNFYLKYERNNETIYIKAKDKISTIIDFGTVTILGGEKYKSEHIYTRTHDVTLKNRKFLAKAITMEGKIGTDFPLHDAYKLLMFSLFELALMRNEERMLVFKEISVFLGFFVHHEVLTYDYVMDEKKDPTDGFFSLPPIEGYIGKKPFQQYVNFCVNIANTYDLIKNKITPNDFVFECKENDTEDYIEDRRDKILLNMGINTENNLPQPKSLYELIIAYEDYIKIFGDKPVVKKIMNILLNKFDLKQALIIEKQNLKKPNIFTLYTLSNNINEVILKYNIILKNADYIAEFLNDYAVLRTLNKILNKTQDLYIMFQNRDIIKEKIVPDSYIGKELRNFKYRIDVVIKHNLEISKSFNKRKDLDKKNKYIINSIYNKYMDLFNLLK